MSERNFDLDFEEMKVLPILIIQAYIWSYWT